ncbi:hypothetical protein [Lachnoclostridium sp. MSJ-17]|uniref:hypothetical protein n=1 Tax=Lachnoclostridium sp. MSJ-17 TaxID=2841516 RepID=UPI001C113CD3|nr:hypothetical protein [Lachnoclostridium sp. MSJ-17]MBU5462711.1 hypothetical protein [Lachnoclostridium sp. MSJ-17]
MRKTGYYSANDCDFLEEGEKLRLEHDLRFQPNDKILLPLVNASDFDLYELRALAVSGEKKVFEQLKELAEVWEQKASLTMLIDRALSYKRVPQVEHTSNQWQQSHYRDTEIVSNMVYKMSVSLHEDNHYDNDTGQFVSDAWIVTWGVSLNTPDEYRTKKIAGQDRKRFSDKDAALKYIDGRKKAYAHLFTEISPPIPERYADRFSKNGLLLPGYVVEGKPVLRTDVKAVDFLNALSDGDFMPDAHKPSVLGKISDTKSQQKAEPAAPSKKKKEPEIT